MGLFSLDFPEELPEIVRRELDSHFAKLKQLLGRSLNEDGSLRVLEGTGSTGESGEPNITVVNQLESEEGHFWRRGPWTIPSYGDGAEGRENAHHVITVSGGTLDDFCTNRATGALLIDVTVDSATTITGLARDLAEVQGRFVILRNLYQSDATKTLTLKHSNTGSLLQNRFFLPGAEDIVLAPGEAVWLFNYASVWEAIVTGQSSGGIGASTGNVVQRANLTLTDAEIKTLGTTPVTIVPAVAGKVIYPIAVFFIKDTSAGAYDVNRSFNLRWAALATDLMNATTLTLAAATKTYQNNNSTGGLNTITTVSNSALRVTTTGNPTGGNGANTIKVGVSYYLVDD